MNRSVRLLATAATSLIGVLLIWPVAASAAGLDASIDHSEISGRVLRMLVSVPGVEPVDLNSVAISIGGAETSAKAEEASQAAGLSRTTILAIDTSKSMAGARISEAKKAANAYLSQVPANVKVGIVTFDSRVNTRLAPTLDRAAARRVIGGLTLALRTHLYDGVLGAVRALGTGGARQILLLSDGKDTTGDPLGGLVKTLSKADAKLDVISLQQSDSGNAALNAMAEATNGQVINALDPKALSAAFASEADALARQVLVTATVPASEKATDANVTVTLRAGSETYTDTAFLTVRDHQASPAPETQNPLPVTSALALPRQVVLGAIVAIGMGIIGIGTALSLRPRSSSRGLTIEDQIGVYGATGMRSGQDGAEIRSNSQGPSSLTAQAKHAAESVLANNRGVEAKIAKMLEGSGLSLRPAEWLIVHTLIVLGSAAVGVLIGAGNPVLIVLLILFGFAAPWLYLKFKTSRRLAAFGASLPDTLQLMSGSLSAGLSLAQSLDTIVREGSEPITSEYRRVIVESRLGVPLEDALEGVAERMESRDFEWVVMAIRIQRQVGGNLAELLQTVAATLREREFLRRHVKALSAEGRLSAYILCGLPPAFLGYLTLTKWDYVRPLFVSPVGWLMLGTIVVLLLGGAFWMSKVVKAEL